MKNTYINYDSFELICWDTDGNNTNVILDLTKEQVKQICKLIGLIGFQNKKGEIYAVYTRRRR